MLLRTDPFRELARLAQAIAGRSASGLMPLDAYRREGNFIVHFDLPGVEPSSIDLTVEKNVLTVTAERRWQPSEEVQIVASERPQGRFSRQLFLGESLDAEHVTAGYEHGVLTVTIPVAEQAKARKVEISTGSGTTAATAIETESAAA